MKDNGPVEKSYQRFYPYFRKLKPVRWHFACALVCSLVYGASSGFGIPFMCQKVFPKVFGAEALAPITLFLLVAYLPLVFLVRALSGYFSEYLIHYCGVKVLEDLRNEIFRKLQRLPLAFFQRRSRGDLLSRVMNDASQLQMGITRVTNSLVREPVTFLGAVGALVYLAVINHEIIFILFSLMIVPACVFPARYAGRKLYRKAKGLQKETARVTETVNENLGAAREVRAFSLEERQAIEFTAVMRQFVRWQLKVVQYSKFLSPVIEFISSLGVALAVFYAAKARVGLEEVVALIGALYMSYSPLKKIGQMHNQVKQASASLERLEEILREPETISDREGAVDLGKVEGRIEFQNLSFSYGDGPVLRGVSCVLAPGEVHALVGPSGSGKSTFAHLIPRFYDATEGSVTLDGEDVRNIRLASLRRNVAFVPQDPVLFNDTIFRNIHLSRPSAGEEEVYEAARQAYAHDFIRQFGQGYETIVGERGTRLSGGQKQRIALARAFLTQAPVLILDEATSALDAESEEKIQLALTELTRGKTVILIAHRLSSVRQAGRILVFDRGRVVAQGPHGGLIESCPLYRSLWEKQILPL